MNNTRAGQGWGQYILNGKPNWSKIVIAGHSQGGALAGVIGRHYPVKRAILISIVDMLDNGKIPDWEKMPANNVNFYSFINMNDELMAWPRVKAVWTAAGWFAYGNYLNVDWKPYPYNNTHLLVSTYKSPSTSIDPYHNMTGVDSYFPKYGNGKYVYEKAWEYLLR
jgi:pimeloyl-ACP methyl ester carboxylesterase